MDTTPFYELKDRLYAAASAGCSTLSEDFRFKRAAENFKPLSKSNKVFGKLYDMCKSLVSAENPAPVLADCLALAEALAVTQGIFSDGSETKNCEKSIAAAADYPYSRVDDMISMIRKAGADLLRIPPEDKKLVFDPRVFGAFLDYLENGRETEDFKIFTEIICGLIGCEFVPILKSEVRSSGKQIKYVKFMRGEEENDWYVSLAENKDNPENVRREAVSAMACSAENTEKLIEFYNTEKGKVKKEALMSLALLSPPEAEPIFQKLCDKYKGSYACYVTAASGKACTDFTVKKVKKALAKNASAKADNYGSRLEINEAYRFLANKNSEDTDKLFLAFNFGDGDMGWIYEILIDDVKAGGKIKDAAAKQINRLYEKNPKKFCVPKAFLDIVTSPDSFSPEPEFITQMMIYILSRIYYIPMLKGYYVGRQKFPPIRLWEHYPESLIKYCALSERYIDKFMAQKIKIKDVNTRYHNLQVLIHNIMKNFQRLLENCNPEDFETLKSFAVRLAEKSAFTVTSHYALTIICHYGEESDEELIKINTAYVLNTLKYTSQLAPPNAAIWNLDKEKQIEAIKSLHKEFYKLKGSIDDKFYKGEEEYIVNTLKRLGEN